MTFGQRTKEGEVENGAESWARKPKESSHQVKARAWQGHFAPGDSQSFQ